MKKINLTICILFTTLFVANAQLESNIWYFGQNSGITFSSNPPTALTNGALSTSEGCATICDASGNLLFYTDGMTVYNKLHQIMDNGTGLNGHFSATQSAIIVPKPANTIIYYVFTVDAIGNQCVNGLRYSEVDISMNGGLGKVINKNIALTQPTSEKVTVARHSNNIDYWVITHGVNNNNFYSFLVSSSGINTTPITSSVGAFQNLNPSVLGYLKSSNNSQKLVSAKWTNELELFDFNNTNGTVSNAIQISNNENFYGVEFSQNNSKLYVSLDYPLKIYQYDLLAANIANSKDTIYNSNTSFGGGALQIGIDHKIYFSLLNSSFLGVINNPNDNNCNFVLNAIYLSGKKCNGGLPNIIPSLIIPNCAPVASFTASDTIACQGEQVAFVNITPAPTTSQKWLINGVQFDTSFNTNYIFNNIGNYTISLIAYNDTCSDTTNRIIYVNTFKQIALNPVICQGEIFTVGIHNYTTTGTYSDTLITYLGCDSIVTTNLIVGQKKQITLDPIVCQGEIFAVGTHSYTITGTYIDTLTTYLGCDSIVTTNLTTVLPPIVNLGSDTTICEGTPFVLNVTTANATYLWQDNSTNPTYNVTLQGLYWVMVTVNNCSSSDSINVITEDCEAILELPNIITPNNDRINDVFMPIKKENIQKMNTLIYSRWGNLVYETDNLNIGWDGKYKGKYVADGVYYWIVNYTSLIGKENTMNGSLTIMK